MNTAFTLAVELVFRWPFAVVAWFAFFVSVVLAVFPRRITWIHCVACLLLTMVWGVAISLAVVPNTIFAFVFGIPFGLIIGTASCIAVTQMDNAALVSDRR
jgi:hypothetical protein